MSDPAVARSGVRRRALSPRRRPVINEPLAARLAELIRRHATFGYRRLWALLRFREGARITPKTVYRICALKSWFVGDAPGRWESFRHLQAQAGAVPVTKRSGKQRVIYFRFACDKSLRHVVDQVAFLSLLSSKWARAYYDQQRARGHSHHQALRALGAKWLKIIFVMWHRQVPYGEQYHLATMTRQQLRQRQKKIA